MNLTARGGMKTQPNAASSDAAPETKRIAPDVIAGAEQGPQSVAGSSPAAPIRFEGHERERQNDG